MCISDTDNIQQYCFFFLFQSTEKKIVPLSFKMGVVIWCFNQWNMSELMSVLLLDKAFSEKAAGIKDMCADVGVDGSIFLCRTASLDRWLNTQWTKKEKKKKRFYFFLSLILRVGLFPWYRQTKLTYAITSSSSFQGYPPAYYDFFKKSDWWLILLDKVHLVIFSYTFYCSKRNGSWLDTRIIVKKYRIKIFFQMGV